MRSYYRVFKTENHSLKLRTEERGVASLEFIIMLPIFIVVFLGVIEFSRMMLVRQKLEKTVSAMGDFVTRGNFACSSAMEQFRVVADSVMEPFSLNDSTITFSSLVNYNNDIAPCTAGVPCISWQNGDYSRIGNAGDEPDNFPGGLIVDQGQNYIVTEILYKFESLLPISSKYIPSLAEQDMYFINIHKPRAGTLSELDPDGCTNPVP